MAKDSFSKPVNYKGPDPRVKCGKWYCWRYLRRAWWNPDGKPEQFCSTKHRGSN